jgi:hypothetical protein
MPTPPSSFPRPFPPITISIVSHGQLALVLPLLDQLDRHCRAVTAKVLLTLNIPEPDLLAGRHWGFEVERIENASPKGFGANHNQAFERCRSDWFLVLNPDIRLDSDVLTPLLAQAAPDAGLLTPRILEPGKAGPEPHRALLTPLEIVGRKKPGYVPPRGAGVDSGAVHAVSQRGLQGGARLRRAILHVRGRFRHLRAHRAGGLEAAGGRRPGRPARRAACEPQEQEVPVLARDQLAEGVAVGGVLAVLAG